MGGSGDGNMADDVSGKAEFVKADKMVSDFLGIEWGHLCPRFGYNHNQQWLLVFEAALSFALFQLVLYAAWRMSARSGSSVASTTTGRGHNDQTLEELEHFSSMVDTHLSSISQTEHNSLATFSSGHHPTQSATSSAMASGKRQQRPDDLQKLKEEFQQRIAQTKAKWKEPDDPNAPVDMEEETDENNIFHNTALLIAVYWSVQAIMSYVVLCSVGISMIGMPDRGVWQHYCLLLYAVSNCGILPSGGQAFAFLVDWWQYEALTTMPASHSSPADASYRALQSVPVSPTGLPELAAPRTTSYAEIDKDNQRRLNEVNEMKWKFVLMCLPQIVPVAFMIVTHTIPFLFAYLWLTLIAALVTYLFVTLAKNIVRRTSADPRQRILRQAKVIAFVFQLVTTLYIHASVQVMTRVYAGEWRHGGYFDSLWLHLLIDSRGGSFSTCPWFSIVRLIDTPLRWT